jgi:hypothetical protein
MLALGCAAAERVDDAAAVIDGILADGLANIPRDALWTGTLTLFSDACAQVRHRAAAELVYAEYAPYAGMCAAGSHSATNGSVARAVGELATLLERYDEAEQHFEEALRSNEAQGFHAWIAWTRLNYGDMLLRRNGPGDRERATSLLQHAYDFAKQSGMGKVERDSAELLASLG